jgi:hypothetical protein
MQHTDDICYYSLCHTVAVQRIVNSDHPSITAPLNTLVQVKWLLDAGLSLPYLHPNKHNVQEWTKVLQPERHAEVQAGE